MFVEFFFDVDFCEFVGFEIIVDVFVFFYVSGEVFGELVEGDFDFLFGGVFVVVGVVEVEVEVFVYFCYGFLV